MSWKQWAMDALELCTKKGISDDSDIVIALKYTKNMGREPYFTLKAAVCRLQENKE